MKVKVIGRKYSEEATYSSWDKWREYPRFEELEEKTWEIEADSLLEGKRWLVENHPDYFMGANIICENGDFSCLAVPCCEYGKGNFETYEARIATAKYELKQAILRDMQKYIDENYEPLA